ncbi:30S ribosomal protein S8 [Candidatus Woesearchaeota archaeon]|nr:30S ribosomal protein S8 [Candidatus Woesearchaeota archaeon]
MLNDTLATALSKIENFEKIGRKECLVMPASKTIKKVLELFNAHGYLGQAELASDARGGALKVHLLGKINKCGVIKPRFAVTMKEYEKFEKRYLPAKNVGVLLVSTPKGMMTHEEAKKNNHGGRLVAYCY